MSLGHACDCPVYPCECHRKPATYRMYAEPFASDSVVRAVLKRTYASDNIGDLARKSAVPRGVWSGG